MRLIRSVIFAGGLLFSAVSINAQDFGGNPPSIKWNQVKTPAARVIFPRGLDSTGIRVANILQRVNDVTKPSIGYRQKQVNIVLQNQSLITNGYVGLAPFRSEFFLTPTQNSFQLGSIPFFEQLSVHEFRHVQQLNNFDVGLTRFLHIIFGEGGQQIGYGLSIPDWFLEGDAVFNESYVTEQGRGRLPFFFNGYRSLWAAGKNYGWMKLRNGSYLDYVPDWYPMGYMLTAYGRDKYGMNVWRGITHDAASYKSLFYPLQSSIKKHTGQDFTSFRTDAFGYFKKQLLTPELEAPNKKYKKNQHFIANEEFPAYVNDTTVIYRKTTYQHRPAFILRSGSGERTIRISDFTTDNYFNYQDGKIVYTALRYDARWTNREYNELKVIDVKTGSQKRISSKTRYFSPAFSNDGKLIVVVDVATTGKYSLHVLDAVSGKLLATVPNKDNLFYTYPKFYNNDQVISAVRSVSGDMSIVLIDIKTGAVNQLTPANLAPKAFPVVKQDTVYFTATAGRNDKLYALDIKSKALYQLQNDSLQSYIGNYQPAVSANKLAWVSFSAFGYQMHQVYKSAVRFAPVNSFEQLSDMGIASLQKDSGVNAVATTVNKPLPVSKYPKFFHPFNFHSLIPNLDDPEYTLSLRGDNILNTFQNELFFNYNRDEGSKEIGFTSIYGGFFPYLFGSASYIMDRVARRTSGSNIYWNEKHVQAGLQLPLTLNRGRNATSINLSSSVVYNITDVDPLYSSLIPDYTYLNNSVTFSNQIGRAKQNINSHLAQSITVRYRNTISSQGAHQLLVNGNFYFPGISPNHSLVINLAYQQRDRNNNFFSNGMPFSRGYTAENFYRMNKLGVNYHFPIAYPDAGIAQIVYFLRVRGNLFYDLVNGKDYYSVLNIVTTPTGTQRFITQNQFDAKFQTIGGELYFDTRWFNQSNVTFGIRYSRLLNPQLVIDNTVFRNYGQNQVSLILPLTIL